MKLDPHKLTWAALLGQWVEFARSAVALPDDADGRKWRAAVPDIIGLQAVTMALRELDQLPENERALGLDRARILIHRHSAALHDLFNPEPLHPMLRDLTAEAEQAVKHASDNADHS